MADYNGNDSNETFFGEDSRRNRAYMAGGNDSAYGGDLYDYMEGGDGNDYLYGYNGDDVLAGGNGDDYLQGGGGDDSLSGYDTGIDSLYGGGGGDFIFASQGDTVDGGTGDDVIHIYASAGAAILEVVGGAGDDTFFGTGGHGAFNGGIGEDVIDYTDLSFGIAQGVTVDLLAGRGGGGAAGDTYWLIEDATGTEFADTLVGNGSVNILIGGAGDDVIAGGGGGDVIDGGAGLDTLDYRTSPGAVTVDLAAGTAYGGDAQEDIFRNMESIQGGAGGDLLSGDAASNSLRGNGGDDRLSGGDGVDTLVGGAGVDRLTGGLGADLLTGGTGADTFVFTASADSGIGAARDRISDFTHADGDKIDLSAIDANTGATRDQAFTFIGTQAFQGNNGELRFAISGTNAIISGDVNGDKVADFQISVVYDAAHPLVAEDFVL